jgi:YHS domain-containing protein
MKPHKLILIIFIPTLCCTATGMAVGAPDEHAGKSTDEKSAVETGRTAGAVKEMEGERCPVMGLPINKSYSYTYRGIRYYFCCPACIETFKADPEKYMDKKASN